MSPESKTHVVPGYPDGTTPDGQKGVICGFDKSREECPFDVKVPVGTSKDSGGKTNVDPKTRE